MAAPIVLNVLYTPQFAGNHIICYQQIFPVVDGPGNYCCITDTTPSVVGVPKTFTIPDPSVAQSCLLNGGTVMGTGATPWDGSTITRFMGYVAPACNPALQTPWAALVQYSAPV